MGDQEGAGVGHGSCVKVAPLQTTPSIPSAVFCGAWPRHRGVHRRGAAPQVGAVGAGGIGDSPSGTLCPRCPLLRGQRPDRFQDQHPVSLTRASPREGADWGRAPPLLCASQLLTRRPLPLPNVLRCRQSVSEVRGHDPLECGSRGPHRRCEPPSRHLFQVVPAQEVCASGYIQFCSSALEGVLVLCGSSLRPPCDRRVTDGVRGWASPVCWEAHGASSALDPWDGDGDGAVRWAGARGLGHTRRPTSLSPAPPELHCSCGTLDAGRAVGCAQPDTAAAPGLATLGGVVASSTDLALVCSRRLVWLCQRLTVVQWIFFFNRPCAFICCASRALTPPEPVRCRGCWAGRQARLRRLAATSGNTPTIGRR